MKVEGFFSNLKQANLTVAELDQTGYAKALVDMNDHMADNWDTHIDPAGSADAPSLSALVLASGSPTEEESNPLRAASPMVSGMGGFEEIMDINCKVIAETDAANADAVRQIITSMGGTLEDPNVRQPRMTANTDLQLEQAIDKLDQGL